MRPGSNKALLVGSLESRFTQLHNLGVLLNPTEFANWRLTVPGPPNDAKPDVVARRTSSATSPAAKRSSSLDGFDADGSNGPSRKHPATITSYFVPSEHSLPSLTPHSSLSLPSVSSSRGPSRGSSRGTQQTLPSLSLFLPK